MSAQKIDDLRQWIRGVLAEEVQAGFPRLSRIPSTGVIGFLDYFAALAPAGRDSLLSTLAQLGAMRFFPQPAVRSAMLALIDSDSTFLQYRAAMLPAPFTMGLRYQGLRMAKSMLSDRTSMEMMA